ncbi:MAG: DNA recombination protein RmuC [Acidobacteria bacterium]|nr:DNA recombination protein RmuC [Acidobacteriota bacterium]
MAGIFLFALGIVVGLSLAFLLNRKYGQSFQSLAAQALLENNKSFVEIATSQLEKFQIKAISDFSLKEKAVQDLVSPLQESLERYQSQLSELERKREQAYGGIRQYLDSVVQTQVELRKETGSLVKALRAPHVRGHWGEVTLRRVVELAGMIEHCDFMAQSSMDGATGRLRPDLIVTLPNGRKIVIDSKVPLDSYLNAVEAENEQEREQHLMEHCRQVQRHMASLSSKAYWDQLEESPDFVVLFIPLESLYSAALRLNPQLLEEATQKKIILATPTTLIALLRAVDHGWRQEKLAQNAVEISAIGKEMHDRLLKMLEHFARLGQNLDRAVQAFNETAGSLESRVLVQARRFGDLGVKIREELPDVSWIDRTPRKLSLLEAEPDNSARQERTLHS